MKTTGQDADPTPGRKCSTCGVTLEKNEYDLCKRCAEELEARERVRQNRPKETREQW